MRPATLCFALVLAIFTTSTGRAAVVPSAMSTDAKAIIPGISSVEDLQDIVPEDVVLTVYEEQGSKTVVELDRGGDIIEAVIDSETSTLTLYNGGPDTNSSCYLWFSGSTKCFFGQLYGWYCWDGAWYCIFNQPMCFWMKMNACCQ